MSKWELYEQEKKQIAATSKSYEEYERRIRELCKKLGI
jgi:hypothetical protein